MTPTVWSPELPLDGREVGDEPVFVPLVAVLAVALLLPAAAQAAPPGNDNRASAQAIPTFPANIAGTTVEATVERLDPQVSKCSRIEGTVWYRIDQAPDGTVALSVQGAGLAPVIRVYSTTGTLSELDCSAVAAGKTAQIAFETNRGATYLVLVGRRPSTHDAAFTLSARLYLPPANDTTSEAQSLAKLPASDKGSTTGATSDDNDLSSCNMGGGTVWYSLRPGSAQRLIVKLHAEGNFDATLIVARRVRSKVEEIGCSHTDNQGDLAVAWDTEKGTTYLLEIGRSEGSRPGDFTIDALAAEPRERAPGTALPSGGTSSTVDRLSDVNDVYSTSLIAGTTYRIAFSSSGCANLSIGGPLGEVRSLSCNSYTTFTPGPDGGGRYVFEVKAPASSGRFSDHGGAIGYRIAAGVATPDDITVGLELTNLTTAHGSLAPNAADVVDIYHFDVPQPSDVRIRLGTRHDRGTTIVLLTDTGGRITSSDQQIRLRLQTGRYVVAVRGTVGQPDSTYALALVVRQLTRTTLSLASSELRQGATATFTIATTPRPDEGWIELQIDRFDPLGGWQFNRTIRVSAPGSSVSWTPPSLGRWRARATYLGTLRFSPSRSDYVFLLVANPIK